MEEKMDEVFETEIVEEAEDEAYDEVGNPIPKGALILAGAAGLGAAAVIVGRKFGGKIKEKLEEVKENREDRKAERQAEKEAKKAKKLEAKYTKSGSTEESEE